MSLELRPTPTPDATTEADPRPTAPGTETLPARIAPRRPPNRRRPSGLPATPGRGGRPAPAFDAGSQMPALRQVGTPRTARKVGVALMLSFVVLPFVLALVPWRQSVFGDGTVIGLHPLDRPFTVDSPIYGRVMRFYVNEGDRVQAGDPIATVENIDPRYLETLELQRVNYESALAQAGQQVSAYEAALRQKEAEREQAIAEAEAAIAEAEQKRAEAEQKVVEAQTDTAGYKILYDQARQLYEKGLESGQSLVKAEQIYRTTEQKLRQAEAASRQAEKSVEAYRAKRRVVEAKAEAEIAKARSDLAAGQGYVQKATVELRDAEVKIRQQEQGGRVLSPRDGVVLRLMTNVGAGAQVKDGDPLVTLIPETAQVAAEIYLPGRDIPLVRKGDPVRLQFEGWPALQFIGWPAAAVGTFPAKVALVDATQTRLGKFRVLAVPDMDGPHLKFDDRRGGAFARGETLTGLASGATARILDVKPNQEDPDAGDLTIRGIAGEFLPDEPIQSSGGAEAVARSPWPAREFLRQGARANGWVLLREVPLGFEIWRRLNGFAPVVAQDEPEAKGDGGKDDKPKVKRPK